MAKRLTPAQIAEKQVRRATAAVQDYKDGVASVKESPTKKAAEKVDDWMAGIQRSYQDGSYVDGCNAVSLEDWKQRTMDKGAATYANGVRNSQAAIEDFQAQRQQAQQSIDAELAATPRSSTDINQNIQRMVIQATRMAQFKFKKRRR